MKAKEVCIAVAGSVDSGKSSFIGVLTSNSLDDGKGSARSTVARHPHEVSLGKTSDISTRTINFDGNNFTLVDLCGHEKYLKTTLYGLTGLFPDYGILIVSANRGILPMTKEHLGIYLYLKIPFIILVTRIDITPQNIYESTIKNITKILKKYKRRATIIENFQNKNNIDKIAMELKANPYLTPIVSVSNKTGHNIDTTKYLISKLEARQIWSNELKEGSIFYIDSKFTPTGIGLVLSGVLRGERITVGSEMQIGPFSNGEFKRIKVWSIHNNNKQSVPYIEDRNRGCLAVKIIDKKDDFNTNLIRKGLVVLNKVEPSVCYEFTATVEILNHSSVISPQYSPVIHCGQIRQTAKINFNVTPDNPSLKIGDRKEVSFRFYTYPEFIEKGMTFFFREGKTRGVGIIEKILLLKDDPYPNPTPQNRKRKKRQKKKFFKPKV